MGKILRIGGLLIIVVVILFSVVRLYQFKIGCRDYLKLAGDAPDIYRAKNFLEKALRYIEKKKLTKGNTSLLVPTPSNDLEIWAGQIRGAYEVVNKLVQEEKEGKVVSQLTKDNALMKVREVLVDVGAQGIEVTLPENISLFPYQRIAYLLLLIGVFMFLVGLMIWIIDRE